MKIPFFVSVGYPGSGKTTLGQAFTKKHPDFDYIFVFDFFINNNLIDKNGKVQDPDYIQKGHQFLYDGFKSLTKPTILELGTSLPDFNCRELKKLAAKFPLDLTVLFCICETEVALARHMKRHREVPYRLEYLKKRYKRDFPGQYRQACRKNDLTYFKIDMVKPIEENVKIWEGLLS